MRRLTPTLAGLVRIPGGVLRRRRGSQAAMVPLKENVPPLVLGEDT